MIGRFTWDTDVIVGLSGLEVTEDGMGFLAVGDRGWWLEGRFQRTDDQINGRHRYAGWKAIIGQDGLPVPARRGIDWSDAEGLALGPDGTAWVAFERWAHVWQFDQPFTRARWLKDHPTFHDHAENWQLEAVAVDPPGNGLCLLRKTSDRRLSDLSSERGRQLGFL